MYRLTSLGTWTSSRGVTFAVKSPVSASRDGAAMRNAIGPVVEIDGIERRVLGIEMFMPGWPVSVGENIAILTASESLEAPADNPLRKA